LADSHGVTKFKVSLHRALLSNCIPGGPSKTKGEQAPQLLPRYFQHAYAYKNASNVFLIFNAQFTFF
jgi:hypothetical protein